MKIGLALGGGGARGFFHVGALKALERLKLKIDIISGSSIGAIMGGFYALHKDVAYLEKVTLELADKYRTKVRYCINTHSHFDHTNGNQTILSKTGAQRVVHDSTAGESDYAVKDGDALSLGAISLRIIHTPGHTPGSVCFNIGSYLISGDTVFPGGPGRTKSPDAFSQIIKSLTEKIFLLPDDTQIYPDHGDATVLEKVKEEYGVFSSRRHDPDLCGDVNWLES